MKSTRGIQKRQSGFTLVELIVVIVILGILAAVAIPKLSDTSGAARGGVQDATLGALKSAWSIAYAVNKGTLPTAAQIALQMTDPACPTTTTTTITCNVSNMAGTATTTTFAVALDANSLVAGPSSITLPTANR